MEHDDLDDLGNVVTPAAPPPLKRSYMGGDGDGGSKEPNDSEGPDGGGFGGNIVVVVVEVDPTRDDTDVDAGSGPDGATDGGDGC